jgi:hypothetical protein
MNSTPTRERAWSVFGQLMENEGQLRTGGTLRSARKANFSSVGTTPMGAIGDPFMNLDVHSQSPDAQVPRETDYFLHPLEDDEYDSDSTSSTITEPALDEAPPVRWFSPQRLQTVPLLYRNIFKCAVAYFIASLFTFSPYLASFISDLTTYGDGERRPSPSGHMVATVCVRLC